MLNRRETLGAIGGLLAGSAIGQASTLAPSTSPLESPRKRLTVHELTAAQKAERDRLVAARLAATQVHHDAVFAEEQFYAGIREQYREGAGKKGIGIEVAIEDDYILVRDYRSEYAAKQAACEQLNEAYANQRVQQSRFVG